MKNILLAVAVQRYLDFTPHALVARQVAMDLASCTSAHIHALTIEGKPLHVVPDADLETTEEKLHRYTRPLEEIGIRVTHHILHGLPRKVIIEQAHELDVDLIIMGTHGKRTIMDITVGGTAAAVLSGAPCPVVLAAAPAKDQYRIKELTIPVGMLEF